MFSIAAINDTESQGRWEPLAPTKEAQEFHLSQKYHEGLLKLQAKEYDKACELFESVLKDPLVASAQADSNASDGHLLQLRYLALKNLATVFIQQGSSHYESALQCYLQAVDIDTKDSVLWNQLGTLSCSMGLFSISRWAFEQGLQCSPNNWNCMEKLLEVLIAIGDEIACLSVAELILRHWPSHSRALHVKKTIEDSEPIPFAPRGIDRLEPKHLRLNFSEKRKTRDNELEDNISQKRSNRCIEVHLAEASWAALADALLAILDTLSESTPELGPERSCRSGDVKLSIHMPLDSENGTLPAGGGQTVAPSEDNISHGSCNPERSNNAKNANSLEEQPQERRSTRLERLRSRRPDKEESDVAADKDLVKATQSLEPFIVGGLGIKEFDSSASPSNSCSDYQYSSESECDGVARFVREASKNYGAYHMADMLLEHVANRSLLYQDAFLKFLELEKLIRNWGKDRSPECCLFLAELYCDIASYASEISELDKLISEASYHLCKIIESVALNYPFSSYFDAGNVNCLDNNHLQGPCEMSAKSMCHDSAPDNVLSSNKTSFWVRFFWLSGQLSMFEGNKTKAYEDFCTSVSHLVKLKSSDEPSCSVRLPHCKVTTELTVDRILYVINLLRVDFLLEKTIGDMIEKEMYSECVTLLAPLIFSAKDDMLPLCIGMKRGQESRSTELSALDILIKACCKLKPVDYGLYLNCHRKKLQILVMSAGIDSSIISGQTPSQNPGLQNLSTSETYSRDWNSSISEEVKAISQCVLQVKNFIEEPGDPNIVSNLVETIGKIQSLLLTVMCNIASTYLCKKYPGSVVTDEAEQKQKHCFVDAAIAFCKFQHLTPSLTVQTQVELIVAIHDLLAEYGICCLGFEGEGEEGTFLKFAIKHLLALDMKLKSSSNSSNRETAEDEELNYADTEVSKSPVQTKVDLTRRDETNAVDDPCEGKSPKHLSPSTAEIDSAGLDNGKENEDGSRGTVNIDKKTGDESIAEENELTEDERDELELKIDNALDQCFFCLYGLNLRSDSSYDDDLAVHKNTSRGDYQTKEQCADVFQYILPYAKDSSKSGLVKLRRVLRAIRKHFAGPPEDVLAGNVIDKFLDDPELCEDKLSEEAGSDGFLETITRMMFPGGISFKQYKASINKSSEPYSEVYRNLYYLLAQSEETSATDKWPGFVLTKEGEEFVQQNANLFKYDLIYNPLRFESWQQLGNIYDEEVDLLLNDGSKHINVSAWRNYANLPQRVEISRRRSRRCLLMSLALAKTATQQGEIHELLALVYYDSLQNVVPFYDQQSVIPCRDAAWTIYCENSMTHFKKAFEKKNDWSHMFYMGKLSEKLKQSHAISQSYYEKAISLNPSAVDPVYRMHASRLKKLYACGKQDVETLKVIAAYSFSESTKDALANFCKMGSESFIPLLDVDRGCQLDAEGRKQMELQKLEEIWHILYHDCLSALEICVEGDLKHFHKARYMLAQGLYRRGDKGDFEKAKDELSFCFKSSRSSFTINMWEIDGMVKKGRRSAGNRKALEVNLPESSRKFITCIRKYLLFYLKLLEESRDICTLDRAHTSLRADKRFSLCIEDLVPVAFARHIRALISSLHEACSENITGSISVENLLERLFALFMEQGNLWPEICNLPEMKTSETLEGNLYSYFHQHIAFLEKKGKLEALELINEKFRKRFKNPKLSNSNSAKVCRHALLAWCRSLITRLASVTPLPSGFTCEIQNPVDSAVENGHLLYIELQTNDLWNSSFEDLTLLKCLETEWSPILSNIKNIPVKKVSDENLETITSLLRSSYNFYRESSCGTLQSGVNLYLVPSRLTCDIQIRQRMDGVEILDLSMPRKLLLWAYTLLHGRYAHISAVVKFCEENAKSKLKKAAGALSTSPSTTISSVTVTHAGDGKDGATRSGCSEADIVTGPSASLPDDESRRCVIHHCNKVAGKSETPTYGGDPDKS